MGSGPLVTFNVPTLGRPSLMRAIESLRDQTDPDWQAIVVGDGIVPEIETDERVQMALATPQRPSSAGRVRNIGIRAAHMMAPSQWIAFLDDDDRLTPTYVEHLREQAEDYPWADVIVARMNDPRLGILPHPVHPKITLGGVGISYAVKSEILKNYSFIDEDPMKWLHEDWELLSAIKQDEHRIHISPHIDYLVRNASA